MKPCTNLVGNLNPYACLQVLAGGRSGQGSSIGVLPPALQQHMAAAAAAAAAAGNGAPPPPWRPEHNGWGGPNAPPPPPPLPAQQQVCAAVCLPALLVTMFWLRVWGSRISTKKCRCGVMEYVHFFQAEACLQSSHRPNPGHSHQGARDADAVHGAVRRAGLHGAAQTLTLLLHTKPLGAREQMPYMVPYGGQGFMVLPNGAALPPQGLPHYMYSFPMPVPGAHQPSIGVIASGPGAASRGFRDYLQVTGSWTHAGAAP